MSEERVFPFMEIYTTLHRILAEIEKFARKHVKRNRLVRFIQHKSDVGRIQQYRERLRHSLDVFGVNVKRYSTMISEDIDLSPLPAYSFSLT